MHPDATHRLSTLAWGAVGAVVCAWMTPLEPNMLEEGIALHLAQRMVGGEHLYRDLASFTGPLPFELLALLFAWLGDEIAVARGAVALMHGTATAATFALARAARRDALAHTAAAAFAAAPVLLFPLFSLFFYALIAVYVAVWAAWAAVRGVGSARSAALAGALVGLCALCKQNLGPVLALALGAGIVALAPADARWRRFGAYVAGGVAVALATLALYGLRGDLDTIVMSLVRLPLSVRDAVVPARATP